MVDTFKATCLWPGKEWDDSKFKGPGAVKMSATFVPDGVAEDDKANHIRINDRKKGSPKWHMLQALIKGQEYTLFEAGKAGEGQHPFYDLIDGPKPQQGGQQQSIPTGRPSNGPAKVTAPTLDFDTIANTYNKCVQASTDVWGEAGTPETVQAGAATLFIQCSKSGVWESPKSDADAQPNAESETAAPVDQAVGQGDDDIPF